MLDKILNIPHLSGGGRIPSAHPRSETAAHMLARQFAELARCNRSNVDRAVSFVGQSLKVPCAAISLEVGKDERVRIAGFGLPDRPVPRTNRFMDMSRCNRAPFAIGNLLEHEQFKEHFLVAESPHVKSLLAAPLAYGDGRFIGHIIAFDTVPRDFTAQDFRLISSLADLVVDELELNRKIAESDHRLKLLEGILDNAAVGISVNDLGGQRIAVNGTLARMLGVSQAELLQESIWERILDEDRHGGEAAMAELLSGRKKSYQRELRYRTQGGGYIWGRVSVSKMETETGPEPFIVAVIEDIGVRRKAESLRDLLLSEVNHRVKNTLAIVQGIAKQLLRMTKSPEEFSEAFELRLQAIAKSHDMLTDESWQPLPLGKIIEHLMTGQWEPYAERLKFAGCDVQLNAQTTVMLSLLLHELLTNAIKHGALMGDQGWIDVTAVSSHEDDLQRLNIEWQEHGARIDCRPERKGLGTFLIERGARLGLSGKGSIEFRPHGLKCNLSFPIFGDPKLERNDLRS